MLVACSVEALVQQEAIAGRIVFLRADAAYQMEVAVEVEVARVVTAFE